MPYYVLKSKFTGVLIMRKPVISGNLEFDFGVQKKLDIPTINFVMDKDNSQGELTDFISTTLPGLTISKKFKQALDKAGVDNIDYYPARVTNEVTREVFEDIYVANVIGLIACMDTEKSEYETYPGIPNKINEIDTLVLHDNAIKGYKIFRLKEFSTLVIVDENVKDAIENAGITNTICIPVEEFDTYL